jgi:transposase
MSRVVIGMDPHKRSAAIEIMAGDEAILGGGRFATDAAGYAAMFATGKRWPERVWAVEGCQGIGRQLACRLLADGEQVIDVPAKLSARMRVFATGQGRKTDATDAHSVALAATRMTGRRPVVGDQQLAVLRILAGRRRVLGEDHTRMVCQLHHLLLELIPGGAKKDLSAAQAKALLAKVRPRDAAGKARRRVAAELISDLERACQRKKAANKELRDLLAATSSTLTSLHGIGPSGAARLLAEAGDITRCPAKAHFASWNGTAPTGRLLRRPGPPPPVPGRQPPDQPRPAHHGRRPAPHPHRRPRLLRPQSRRRENTDGSDARPQTPAARHRLPPDGPRPPGSANGPGRTRGGGYRLQRGRLQPQHRRFGEVTSRARQPPTLPRQANPFSTPSPPRPASAGPQPRSSALCLTTARTGAHSQRRERPPLTQRGAMTERRQPARSSRSARGENAVVRGGAGAVDHGAAAGAG